MKASGRARKHMRSCDGCREYRVALRGMRRSFAALAPVGLGPIALRGQADRLRRLGRRRRRGGAAAGGGSAAVAGGAAAATACKVAAVVCTAAIATGGAVEVNHQIRDHAPARAREDQGRRSARSRTAVQAPVVVEPRGRPQAQTPAPAPVALPRRRSASRRRAKAKRDAAQEGRAAPRSP